MTSEISKLRPPFRKSLRKILRNFPMRNEQKGQYGGLKKLGKLLVKRTNGIAIRLQSLGSIGLGTSASSWTNPPNAPNRIGTLQGQLSFWKGQKRWIQNRILNG